MPRRIRARFKGKYILDAQLGIFSFSARAAILSYAPSQGQAPVWNMPATLTIYQGSNLDLKNYVSNPNDPNYPISAYGQASGTPVATLGVTLNTANGVLTAAPGAPVSTTSGMSFYFDYTPPSGLRNLLLSAQTGSFMWTGRDATLVKPPPAGPVSVTATQIAYAAPGTLLNGSGSKNLVFMRLNDGTKDTWFKLGGDHMLVANTPQEQGGRQEIFEVNFATNAWSTKQAYFVRNTSAPDSILQCGLPDDPAGCVVGNEYWMVGIARVVNSSTQVRTDYCRTGWGSDIIRQEMENMVAWNPVTNTWRIVAPFVTEATGNAAWFASYDAKYNRIVIPNASGCIVTLDGTTGADLSHRTTGGNLVQYGTLSWAGNGIAQVGRVVYVHDIWHGRIIAIDLETGPPLTNEYTISTVATIASLANNTLSQTLHHGDLVWHPGVQALIITTSLGRMAAYQPATGAVTEWATRVDGWYSSVDGHYIPPSTMIYDPGTGYCYSIGGIDFGTATQNPYYTRLDFH